MTRRPSLTAHPARPLRQAGFTLVELMVALLIGFVVVGALLAAYMASFRSTAHNDALSQVTEDATLALNIMRAQAAMAGYSQPYSIDNANQIMKGHTLYPVFGCSQSNFATPFQGIMTAQACVGTSNSDTLEVAYQANDSTYAGGPSNAVLNGAGLPLDCLGNTFAKNPAEGGFYLADNKFYVSNGRLYCQGPGNMNSGAPLVDNVDQMTVLYGYADTNNRSADGSYPITAYMPAPATPPTGADDWNHVISITLCVVTHSTTRAIEPDGTATNPLAAYVDCNGNTQHSLDGLLRRSFSTTVVLQNKLM